MHLVGFIIRITDNLDNLTKSGVTNIKKTTSYIKFNFVNNRGFMPNNMELPNFASREMKLPYRNKY